VIEPELAIVYVEDEAETSARTATEAPDADPGVVVLTCANCGAAMGERKCKLISLGATCTVIALRRRTGCHAA
jgi:hypothetical protein